MNTTRLRVKIYQSRHDGLWVMVCPCCHWYGTYPTWPAARHTAVLHTGTCPALFRRHHITIGHQENHHD